MNAQNVDKNNYFIIYLNNIVYKCIYSLVISMVNALTRFFNVKSMKFTNVILKCLQYDWFFFLFSRYFIKCSYLSIIVERRPAGRVKEERYHKVNERKKY